MKPKELASLIKECVKEVVIESNIVALRKGFEPQWAKLDWRKTNGELSKETGVAEPTIAVARWYWAPTTIKKHRWDTIDWRKSNEEIGRLVGVTPDSVAAQRQVRAPETIRTGRKPEKWADVDWRKTDTEISKELGLNVTNVKNARNKYTQGMALYAKRQKIKPLKWSVPYKET